MRGIGVSGATLRIGALETLHDISTNPLVRRHFTGLATAAGLVAGPQLRNMGTIGGNVCLDTRCTYYNQTEFWRGALGYCLKKDGDICHVTKVGKKCVAAHSADTPPNLIALGATLALAGPSGTREIDAADFFITDGIWNTRRASDEILTEIRIPLMGPVSNGRGEATGTMAGSGRMHAASAAGAPTASFGSATRSTFRCCPWRWWATSSRTGPWPGSPVWSRRWAPGRGCWLAGTRSRWAGGSARG